MLYLKTAILASLLLLFVDPIGATIVRFMVAWVDANGEPQHTTSSRHNTITSSTARTIASNMLSWSDNKYRARFRAGPNILDIWNVDPVDEDDIASTKDAMSNTLDQNI
ncbi:hypothetical protein K461DRAFT_265907 [Myriangium duriaei CBS 260.36]|uniref:Uncharacterized protein n=1 Tax=Myriangium duriaei CBS 260.36 TaxID=1168546 RepID=A0A9P4J7Y9_9PEZI|nr:hypothetical protein K461DRAFT_265907 [Myriangium duriaei CBS 260.36]